MLSSGSSYSIAPPPPPAEAAHDGKRSQHPEAPREPILLRLPDEVLEQMIAAASTDRRSLRLASDAQGLSIIVGSDQQAFQLLKSNQDTDLQHCLYRSDRPESSSAGVQRLEAVANIVSQYSAVRSATVSNRSSMAAAHLKERREEELSRKLSSRSVLLEQSQFDKRGKLAATTKTSKASASSSTRDQSRGSPMIRGPSSSMASSSTPSGMSRTKSQAEVQLGSSRDTPPGRRNDDVTRSPHPVTGTGPSSRAMTPSASSSGPSLRQRLLHLLAAGPQARQRIVHSIPTSPEASILRLLSVVASCTDQKQTDASLYTLTDAAYREVATHIGAGAWPLCSKEDKAVIVQQTEAALERQKAPKKAPEWKALAQWTGTVEESRPSSASTRRPRTDTSAPQRAGSPSSVTSSHSSTRERNDDTDMESDRKAEASTSTASRKASGSTTRERLTRAVKGRGSSKNAEEVKKQQEEQQRRRVEREQAEAGEVDFRDATPMSQGMRRTASTSPSKKEQGKSVSGPASPVAPTTQAKLKATREERMPSASRDNPQEPLSSVVKKERKRELEVESADSNPLTVPVKRSKVDAFAQADSKRSVATSVSAPSHHGPSASASLTTAEPWLDVRTAKEWRHLAERFQRVWQRHEECAKALEWEKDRLKREREKAEVDALQEEVVDEGDTSREPEEKDDTATPRGKKDSSDSKSSAERGPPLEEGEEGSASSQEEGEESQPAAVVDDVRRVVLVPLTVWREDDQSNKVTSQPSSTPSSALPLSWDDLLRLVEAHRARDGELKRMKTALTSWKEEGGEV